MDPYGLLATAPRQSGDGGPSGGRAGAGVERAGDINSLDFAARARRLAEELLTQGDLSVAEEILAPNCIHHAPVPIAPGPAGLSGWVVALRSAFPDLYAIVEDEIAEGVLLVQRLTVSGTQVAPFCRLRAKGRHMSWRVLVVMRAAPDGKLAEHWTSWDRLR
jgi:predicted ester cyclase